MRRVRISLPASVTNLGPGIDSLGLALGLHCIVDIVERTDTEMVIEAEGETLNSEMSPLRHPIVLGMLRVFQQVERAPLGMTIRVENRIPFESGLGAEAAMIAAGLIGANNLMDTPLKQPAIIALAAEISRTAAHAVTSILGGLTTSLHTETGLMHRGLPIKIQRVVLALPTLPDYRTDSAQAVPEKVLLVDALANLTRLPALLDAFREADYALLAEAMQDRLFLPSYQPHITAYDHVIEMARRAGASAFCVSGAGPALVFFAADQHRRIADAVQRAFQSAGVNARVLILPVDTQGVVVSAARSG